MDFSLTHFIGILIFSASIFAWSLAELDVLHHYPIRNGTTIKLTCVSENDGAALVWNYDPTDEDLLNNGQGIDIFTNFQPKNPTSKNLTECAIWNSTKCSALWEKNIGWNVVDSGLVPMGPVFDYRWEDLEEIVLKESTNTTAYQYIGTVKDYYGTAILSVRGSSGIEIFLCENKEPWNGQCFWIIIGDSKGKRSEIRSCVNGTKKTDGSIKKEDCMAVAAIVHEAKNVVDAYAWRTFRLEWNSEKKEIKIFNETEVEPFLQGNVDQWHPVSHLSIKSELLSRIRFHFYEYFLTKKNNAVLSTAEFILHDENFCVEVLVGLCPECKLNVILVDDEIRDIPIATISEEGKSVRDKLMTWHSVRLNATLPNLNSRLVKLKMVTIPMKNEVEGLWTIDKFRKCKSVVGLRKSTISINREIMAPANPFFPTVKCQKLSYTGNIIVDSISGSPYRDRGGLILRRKSRDVTTAKLPSNETLELYEADLKNNSISLRLKSFQPNQHGIEKYVVAIKNLVDPSRTRIYDVSQGLQCSLWKESVCLENFPLPRDIILLDSPRGTSREIVVSGQKGDTEIQHWEVTVLPKYIDDSDANKPSKATWKYDSHGIGTLKWEYPSLPKTNIKQFNITITRETTNLLPSPTGSSTTYDTLDVKKVTKEYTKLLQLLPSSDYTIDIRSINQRNSASNPTKVQVKVPSGISFDPKTFKFTNNGTWIELKIPAVVNVTNNANIKVCIKGLWTCGTTENTRERIVRKYKVEFSQPMTEMFDANETMSSDDVNDCFLNHGEKYYINVEVVDEISNTNLTLDWKRFSLPSVDGETIPEGQIQVWILLVLGFTLLLGLFFCFLHFVPYNDRNSSEITPRARDNSTLLSECAIN